jgi:hypothetical protein
MMMLSNHPPDQVVHICVLFPPNNFKGKMAIKNLIALCLLFVAVGVVVAEAEAEAEAEPYYGYYGRSNYYNNYNRNNYYNPNNYNVRRSASYGYRPSAYASYPRYPKPVAYRSYKPLVRAHPAPPPPQQEPVPVRYVEEHRPAPVRAFMPVPAVPQEHVVAYEAAVPQSEPTYTYEPQQYQPQPQPQPAYRYEGPQHFPAVYSNDIDVVAAEPIAPADPVHQVAPAHPVGIAPNTGVVASQYHAQDEFGNVIYGYSNPNSAKTEQRDSYGNVVGSYSYDDGTGFPKHVSYVADDFGFRVTSANNHPVHHV